MNQLARARQFVTNTAEVINTKTGRIVAITSASMLVPFASAQTANATTGLNFPEWITQLKNVAVASVNEAGPALFGLMALIGGVYFVWNRVRSLW